MKKLQALSVISAAALGILVTGCSLLGGNDNKVEYIAVQEEEDGAWSFMDREGKILLDEEFTGTAYGVYNGMFAVRDNGKYALYVFDEKKPMPVHDCDELQGVGLYSEGLVPIVREHERISLVNKDGETQFALEPYKNKEIISCHPNYSEGLLCVRTQDEVFGYVDTKGNMVIEPKYDHANPFVEGLAVVATYDKDNNNLSYKIIDKKGEVVFSLKKKWYSSNTFQNGRLVVTDDDDHIYICDKKGEMEKCPGKVSSVADLGKKAYAFANSDNEWGVMTYDGEMIVRPKYNYITIMDDGRFLGSKDESFDILNADGDVEVTVDDYKYPAVLGDFCIVANDKGSHQFFNLKGEELRNANFKDYNMPIGRILESDFFNTEGFAADIANLVTENGIGKFTFATQPRTMVNGSPDDFRYKSSVELTDLDVKGYRYEINPAVNFTASLTTYDYNSGTYSGTYSWNPDCKVGLFSLNISCIQVTRDIIDSIKAALEKKGFTEITAKDKDSDNVVIIFKKGTTLLGLFSEIGSFRIKIEMVQDEDGTITENLKQHINDI